ncbi:DUF6867 family protein [Rhodoligotrophos ferricapiens]|uniref:DUF6867 family protein n=1 Tax=Rhodoligotrophos ferricapiens TaxID=3069264 RepID=UPI00315C4ED7
MTEPLLGSSLSVFLGVTVVLAGFAAYMTGRAIAKTWRSPWQTVFYSIALAAVSRFLKWSLFGAEGLSLSGFLIDFIYLALVSFAAYRVTMANNMVRQYPWLYERSGIFAWKDKL